MIIIMNNKWLLSGVTIIGKVDYCEYKTASMINSCIYLILLWLTLHQNAHMYNRDNTQSEVKWQQV